MQSGEGSQTAARRVQRGTLCQSATARGEESPRETRVCRRGRVRCSATMCVTDVHCAPSALCVDRLGLLGAPLTDEKMRSSPHYTRQSPRRPSTARGAGPPRAAGSGLRILVFSPPARCGTACGVRPAHLHSRLAGRRAPRPLQASIIWAWALYVMKPSYRDNDTVHTFHELLQRYKALPTGVEAEGGTTMHPACTPFKLRFKHR